MQLASQDKALQVRSASLADYELLASFLSRSESAGRSTDFWQRRFRWWWEDNPAFEERTSRGWLLSSGDVIVGFLGMIPSQFQLAGTSVTAFSTTTWRVEPEHRNHSLRLFSEFLRCGEGSVIFDTTPTNEVIRILDFYGFRLLPHIEKPQSSIILLNPEGVLRTRIKVPWATEFVAWVGKPLLRYFQERSLRARPNSDTLRLSHLSRADSAFDELWLRTQHLYANTNVRSASVVNWLCFGNADSRKELFGCFGTDGLHGYLIAARALRNGLNILKCLDLWLDTEASLVLPILLAFVQDFARDSNYDYIEIPHFHSSHSPALTDLGLLRRSTEGDCRHYYRISDGRTAMDPSSSYFVSLQGDAGL